MTSGQNQQGLPPRPRLQHHTRHSFFCSAKPAARSHRPAFVPPKMKMKLIPPAMPWFFLAGGRLKPSVRVRLNHLLSEALYKKRSPSVSRGTPDGAPACMRSRQARRQPCCLTSTRKLVVQESQGSTDQILQTCRQNPPLSLQIRIAASQALRQ
eukprot:1557249-Rhodomonas_salina.1